MSVLGRVPSVELSNGRTLPMLGLGCANGVRKDNVKSALSLGYTSFDTAQAYFWGYHEDEVGDALKESGIERKNVFVQTKVEPADLGFASTMRSFEKSLRRLSVDYLDSILIHKPFCFGNACKSQPEGTWLDSWHALEKIYESGRVHAIGICDVDEKILNELLEQKHKPHIIQNWMDPFHQDTHMRARCKQEGIQYQAYSTLGTQWKMQGHRESPVLSSPVLNTIARAHNRSVAQVVMNWAVRHGVSVLPASKSSERQAANLNSFDFELTLEDMTAIDALDGTLSAPRPSAMAIKQMFENKGMSPAQIVWVNAQGGEVQIGDIAPGAVLSVSTYDGHTFRYKYNSEVIEEYVVNARKGAQQHHVFGLEL